MSDDKLEPAYVRRLIEDALNEDGARDDVTTRALVDGDQRGRGVVLCKASGVIAGLPLAAAAFVALHPMVRFQPAVSDGDAVAASDAIARIEGPLAPILSAERVALNFLQRLSGIASLTRRFVEAVDGLPVRILDTRKTTPGLRPLERYAVRTGGGHNHRYNLSDAVLIKDNHLAAARKGGLSIARAVATARDAASGMTVEVEVTSLDEAQQAIDAAADAVLLDNMPVEEMRRAVKFRKGDVRFEASGGVTLENVRAIAETGVDDISIGALTHSAPALDLSLELES